MLFSSCIYIHVILMLTLFTVDRQKYTDKFRNVVLEKDGDQLYRP
jgi:hypothetical protein